MITALQALLARHDGGPLVLTNGARLCRVLDVDEVRQECLVQDVKGKNLHRDWHDLHVTETLIAMEEAFRLPAPRKPYNGGELVLALPMSSTGLLAGFVCVVRLNDTRGHFVGFYTQGLGQATWDQGHYFMEDISAALAWAVREAGLIRKF
jgi:hypothetical protein